MLSRQRQSDPQRGEPFQEGHAVDFHLVMEGGEGALSLPEVMPPTPQGGSQSWRLLLITLLSCFAASGAALGAFLWLINLPPTANCENPASVTTDRAQLFCAQTAAESGELQEVVAALDLVGGWTAEHPLHYEVQPLIEQWSWVVLKAAEAELRSHGSLAEAQTLVSHIPVESPVFAAAQETMATWQTEWEQGEALMATAQTALQRQDWPTASQQVLALAELKNPHWRVDQVQALSRQIRQERRAQTLLAEAIATAAPGGSDRLATALKTASQIDLDTYARQQAQPYLNRWSDLLLKLGLDYWYASRLDGAIALGRAAALNPSRAQPAQELIWLSQARQQAQQSLVTWRSSPDQLVKLYRAMLLANRLPQTSPYYGQAQSSLATWRQQLGDLTQLQTAQTIGQVRDIGALKTAIDQAAKVPVGHPRRVQAQTLVAHWRQEIERLEDRPYLVEAHRLARDKTPAGLQAAIQTANTVPLHRALRGEAQGWAYLWTTELQILEDQPLLDRARSLAAAGRLSQAIVEAAGVKPGRALYSEAQAAIASWQWQIAAAEQARRRALQRATAPQPAATEIAEPAEAAAEAELLPTGEAAALDGAPPMPEAPVPLTPVGRPWRPPLPSRIETVPGDAAPGAASAPGPDRPAAPAAEGQPASIQIAPPPAAPMPPPPVAPPPVAPALVAPPAAAPPVDLAPAPAAVPDADAQTALPAAIAISTRPQPEAPSPVVQWSAVGAPPLVAQQLAPTGLVSTAP